MTTKSANFLFVVGVMGLAGCSPSPKTYDDCLLTYLKPGMTNAVASEVKQACIRKFPGEVAKQRRQANPFDQFDEK